MVTTPDEILDAAAEAAHRRDVRRTVIITSFSLGLVLVSSVLVALGGGTPA